MGLTMNSDKTEFYSISIRQEEKIIKACNEYQYFELMYEKEGKDD